MYIPKDLEDCFVQLKKLLPPKDRMSIRNATEEDRAMRHFGLGMWMRNNWRLWGGSGMAAWFLDHGISEPDEMSATILRTFRQHLRGEEIGNLKDIRRGDRWYSK